MIKLAVLFGGKSSEHNISVVSGTSIISNLNKDKYEIFPIYMGLDGNFYKYTKNIEDIKILKIDEEITEIELIDNIFEYLSNVDVVFPVLHGLYGEDGTIQGMLKLIGKKYVGCGVLASALCMDKVYAKTIFKASNIEVAKDMYIKKNKDKYFYINNTFDITNLNEIELQDIVQKTLNYPIFIKPSNSGSSFGVNKANNKEELIKYLNEAFMYDDKALLEEAIIGREVECAVMGNDEPIASYVGEVLSAEEFYSYDSKYKNKESVTVIPANLDDNTMNKIRELAIKAYRAIECKGLSRVDFFIEDNTGRIILNEINTLPGFTEISMYPKLMEHLGYDYSTLLDKIIELAINS